MSSLCHTASKSTQTQHRCGTSSTPDRRPEVAALEQEIKQGRRAVLVVNTRSRHGARTYGSQEATRGGRNHARCGLSRSERREAAGDSAGGNCQRTRRRAHSGPCGGISTLMHRHPCSNSAHQHRVLTVVGAIEGRHCLPAFRREPRGISVSDVAKLFRAIRCHALILQDRQQSSARYVRLSLLYLNELTSSEPLRRNGHRLRTDAVGQRGSSAVAAAAQGASTSVSTFVMSHETFLLDRDKLLVRTSPPASPPWRWDMDIEKWLRGLGLQQYAAAFRDNAIDAEILPELTDVDLEKLGVVLGHRKRLLKAIAALAAPAAAMQATSVGSAPSHGHDAERRQLTVMFVDLVGSTALSPRLDPEDLREIIGAYHRCVAETVARFDGFVAKYMGDGVLVYFGYPQAHEDDAERAVRAGLALVEAVGQLASAGATAGPRRHRHRPGGRRRSDRLRRSAGARRVGRDAEPGGPAASAGRAGQVVIAASTRRLVGGSVRVPTISAPSR